MKSLEELATIRERMQSQVILREGHAETHVVVGMGTCGIAAGARTVLNTLVEEVMNNDLYKVVTVGQSGCIGKCNMEPVVEVIGKDKERVTYVKVTPEMAKEIVQKHLIGGTPIAEYTIEAVEK